LAFASSANPSGKGNSGRIAGIGERSIQPGASEHTRYEQGVMVSMVDGDGNLIPQQRGRRSIQPGPVVLREGLDIDKIMPMLAELFPSWDYRHGTYY
jgi:hypothetical protein